MEADRFHVHHTLMDLGLGPRQTLVLLVSYATVCAIIGLALENVPEYISLFVYFLLFFSHCLTVAKISEISKTMNRNQASQA